MRPLLETKLWVNLEYLSIYNSYMIGQPYDRVNSRVMGYDRLQELMFTVGTAMQYMPALEYLKLRQIILDEDALKVSKLVYRWQEGKPTLKITGIEPNVIVLQCWRSSVVRLRKGVLKIELDIDKDSMGEDIAVADRQTRH